MPKRISGRHVKASRSYTIAEAAERLGVSVGTVRQWARAGLPIMNAKRPYLIAGGALRDFLDQRQSMHRKRMGGDQFYCLTCREPRKPAGLMVDFIPQTEKTGRLMGICEVCEGVCNQMISNASLPKFREIFAVAIRERSRA